MEVKATPVPALVPNPSPEGPNWVPGLWMVWAERSWDARSKWIYCYTNKQGSYLSSEQGIAPSRFATKAEALQAGIRYVKAVYKSCDCPEGSFLAVPGPFQTVGA